MQDHCKINATQNMISLRKGKEQGGADEVAYASTSMLSHSKRPVQETDQSRVQVDKAKKSSNKGAAAQVRVKDNETFALMVT